MFAVSSSWMLIESELHQRLVEFQFHFTDYFQHLVWHKNRVYTSFRKGKCLTSRKFKTFSKVAVNVLWVNCSGSSTQRNFINITKNSKFAVPSKRLMIGHDYCYHDCRDTNLFSLVMQCFSDHVLWNLASEVLNENSDFWNDILLNCFLMISSVTYNSFSRFIAITLSTK